jgi:hypothetical protein
LDIGLNFDAYLRSFEPRHSHGAIRQLQLDSSAWLTAANELVGQMFGCPSAECNGDCAQDVGLSHAIITKQHVPLRIQRQFDGLERSDVFDTDTL